MADDDIQERLDRLSLFLGRTITLQDVPMVPPAEPEENLEDFLSDGGADLSARQDTDAAEPEDIDEPCASEQRADGVTRGDESSILRATPFDDLNLRMGEQPAERIDFCTWKLVKAYPYRYIGKANGPRVSNYC